MEEMVATRPEALIETTLPRDGESGTGYQAVAREWVNQDPEAFADWTSRQEDPEIFRESAKLLSNRLIKDLKLPEAMTWAESIGAKGGQNTSQVSNVVNHPELQSLDLWTSGFDIQGPSHLAAKHAITLLESDPAEALAWLKRLPEGEIRQTATENMAFHWSKFDPPAVDKWLGSMPEDERKTASRLVEYYGNR